MSIEDKNIQPFYSDHYSLCESGENLLLDEKKKKIAQNLQQRLNQNRYGMVLFVKCNSLSFSINPYFHAFNWLLQGLIMQKEIQYRCPHLDHFLESRAFLDIFKKFGKTQCFIWSQPLDSCFNFNETDYSEKDVY